MAKILFINPNKWGRGITTIWIASHSAILKDKGYDVELFDCTFYKNWTNDETSYNTKNNQYKKTDYFEIRKYNENDVEKDLQEKINIFKPDIIFWSALSSHIHGEGEYVNIQYGYELIKDLQDESLKITGGIQATASPEVILSKFDKIDYLISGESELVLLEICEKLSNKENIHNINGLSYLDENKKITKNAPQKIISDLDIVPEYDYQIFADQTFLRPYNGKTIRAVDYEMSRGCIYTCSYCVETVIQKYYGFEEKTSKGALKQAKNYLRNKSADRIYNELLNFSEKLKIDLVRCQDTNFLTINPKILNQLREMYLQNPINIKLYIETRPEGINEKSVKLLKDLNVDGVGMGIELAGEDFREEKLNRYANQDKIIKAFKLLEEHGIKRTSYNIIGLPDQDEESIKNTIEFNKQLNPDNVTVAFYSTYYGTNEQIKSFEKKDFNDYELQVDGQLRTVSKSKLISAEKLNYYKENFNNLVFNR